MPSECKRACDCCNIRKIRCDGNSPCGRCLRAGIACTSLRERKKSGPRNLRQSKTKILKQQSAAIAAAAAVEAPGSESQIPLAAGQASPPALSPLSLSAISPFAFDDQPFFTGTVLPAPAWDLHRIALPVMQAVLLLYQEKLYGIWPLIQVDDLLFRLEVEPHDAELYALATALCAATLSYLDGAVAQELPCPSPWSRRPS